MDIGAGMNQDLILTGPNSDGNTVILILMGLCVLITRDGVPVPAQLKGAIVDFFNSVLADIGDLQSLDGDLSMFSSHMLICHGALANSGNNALVLMDELGSGTYLHQGVVITQALVEGTLETDSCLAITTH
jgi:DNA mismatch repair protein MutS2